MNEIKRTCIWTNVKPGQTVWTGINGIYRTAPEEPGVYSFVEYYHVGKRHNYHERYAFEPMQPEDKDIVDSRLA